MESVAQVARQLGLRTEVEPYESSAIGAAEVIPLQMLEAYSAFATLGTRVRPFPILKVESADGELLWEPQPERTRALDSLTARLTVSLMEDVVSQGTGYNGIRFTAGLPGEVPAAGKTGTTDEGRGRVVPRVHPQPGRGGLVRHGPPGADRSTRYGRRSRFPPSGANS